MLNCTLLLDSASRFGLKQGNFKRACDAGMLHILVSLIRICTLPSVNKNQVLNAFHWGFVM